MPRKYHRFSQCLKLSECIKLFGLAFSFSGHAFPSLPIWIDTLYHPALSQPTLPDLIKTHDTASNIMGLGEFSEETLTSMGFTGDALKSMGVIPNPNNSAGSLSSQVFAQGPVSSLFNSDLSSQISNSAPGNFTSVLNETLSTLAETPLAETPSITSTLVHSPIETDSLLHSPLPEPSSEPILMTDANFKRRPDIRSETVLETQDPFFSTQSSSSGLFAFLATVFDIILRSFIFNFASRLISFVFQNYHRVPELVSKLAHIFQDAMIKALAHFSIYMASNSLILAISVLLAITVVLVGAFITVMATLYLLKKAFSVVRWMFKKVFGSETEAKKTNGKGVSASREGEYELWNQGGKYEDDEVQFVKHYKVKSDDEKPIVID